MMAEGISHQKDNYKGNFKMFVEKQMSIFAEKICN